MKKVLVCSLVLAASILGSAVSQAYDFGDFHSSTLTTKAWDSLTANDLNAVLAYTNKCIELYAGKAKEMQGSLKDYASGNDNNIFKYWALNDVATCYFIQGKAYANAGKKDQAKEAYNKVVKEFSFGQCWDPKGWFWKPSEAAQKELAQL
jgi:tetratricopeptide (TPR) repeat protein